MKNFVKGLIVFLLVMCTLLMGGLLTPLTAKAEEASSVSAIANDDEYIYYTDLFYAYPYYLVNDPFLSAYHSDVIGLSNTVYNNYNNSLVEWATSLELGLETASSLSKTLQYFSDYFNWSDYSYYDALDSANEYVVKQLLNSNRGEMAGTCERIFNSTEKILAYVEKKMDENSKPDDYVKAAIDKIAKNTVEYFTQITTIDSNKLWSSIKDNIGAVSEGIEAAQAISFALMLEDARIAHLDNIICALEVQEENTVLKQGLERLKDQLCDDFISNFATNYLGKNFLLGKMIDKLGGMAATITGVDKVFALLGVVKLAAFDLISDPPAYKDVLAFEVLREYSKNIHASVGNAADVFDDGPFLSDEIKKYESFFTVYTAINEATTALSEDIANKSNPYSSPVYRHFQEYYGDGTTEIVLSGEGIEDITLDPATANEEELCKKIQALKLRNITTATLKVNAASFTFNVLDALLFQPLVESAKENLIAINNFKMEYGNCNIYDAYTNSVKARVAAIPEDQRIRTDTSNWEYVLENDCELRLQSDSAERNCIYAVNGTIFGNIEVGDDVIIPENHDITINGELYIEFSNNTIYNYGSLTILKDFRLCSASHLHNNGTLRVENTLIITSGYLGGPCLSNNGVLDCKNFMIGSVVDIYFGENAQFCVSGDFDGGREDYIFPKIVFDGSSVQNVKNLRAKEIVVNNSGGLEYQSDIHLYGLYKLNNNPLKLNQYSTFCYDGARFDNSNYGKLTLKKMTLYDNLNANITVSDDVIIPENHDITINGELYIEFSNNTIYNYGSLTILKDFRLCSASHLHNNGTLRVENTLIITSGYLGGPCLSNNGVLDCKNFMIGSVVDIYFGENAQFCVSGDFDGGWEDYVFPKIVFDGTTKQEISNLSAKTVLIENPSSEGVVFETSILVSKLFNHKGNSFSLINGGTLPDYDDDGLKDHLDPQPMCYVEFDESEVDNVGGFLFRADNNGIYLIGYVGDSMDLTLPINYNGQSYQIHDYAFHGCDDLRHLVIPAGITSIGKNAFAACENLTSIYVDSEHPTYHSNENCLIETATKTLLLACQNSTIPSDGSVTSIGEYAFANRKDLTSITIPNYITSIGSSAFFGCSNLESIVLPFVGASAKTENDLYQYPLGYIFGTNSYKGGVETTQHYYDSSLSSSVAVSYYIPSSLKSVTITGGNILRGAFGYCKNLTEVIISSNVTKIGDWAFSNCVNLTTVVLPQSVTEIGAGAFNGCSGLLGIELPNGVTRIGEKAFCKCNSLPTIVFPQSVTEIGADAFKSCDSLLEIVLPNGLTRISDRSFSECIRLTTIVFPQSIVEIGENAFYKCSSLLELTFPNGLTHIGYRAFYDCSRLTTIVFPQSLSNIGEEAFSDCDRLLEIVFSDGTTYIGEWAFKDCQALTNIDFQNSLISIGNYAFKNCSKLTNIVIPNSATNIGEGAFCGCSNLASIVLPFVGASVKTENDLHQYPLGYIFGENNYEGGVETTQHYYDNSLSTAVAVSYYIPSSLKSVTITGGNILRGAFGYCNNLTEVIISSNVTKIGDWAFSNCVNLKKVVLPQSVTKIGAGTFNGCSGLFGIELPNGVTRIGEKAFRNCGSLTSLAIPSSITRIDNNAFENCTNLRLIYMNSSSIASALTSSTACGNLLQNVQTIVIEKSNNNLASFVKDTFAHQETFLSEGVQFLSYSIHVHTWEAVSEEAACYRFERENCTVCGLLKEYTVWVEHDYNEEGICSVCGALCIKFSGASLTLEDNISVNFKVDPKQFEGTGYSNPYVIFAFNGNLFVTTEYTIDSNGRYAFAFSDIAPRMMNDSIIATLYATYEGKQVACQTRSYSVKEYCYNMLARCEEGGVYANNETFKALLVDLLNYGEAAQIYGNYQTETLVTSNLTEAQRNWATEATPSLSTVQNLTYQTIENPSVTWKAGGLLLEDAVTMRFKFATDSIDGLTVKFYTDNNPTGWILDDSSFVATSGGYYVYFDGLKARQMRETVYVTVYCGDTAISNTISYSIESYAYAKQNDSNEKLTVLLEAMMKYGDAAYKYING